MNYVIKSCGISLRASFDGSFPNNSSLNHSITRAATARCARRPAEEVLWERRFRPGGADRRCRSSAYCRVILNAHRKEMTDLAEAERERLMKTVFVVERVLRELLAPEKINWPASAHAAAPALAHHSAFCR